MTPFCGSTVRQLLCSQDTPATGREESWVPGCRGRGAGRGTGSQVLEKEATRGPAGYSSGLRTGLTQEAPHHLAGLAQAGWPLSSKEAPSLQLHPSPRSREAAEKGSALQRTHHLSLSHGWLSGSRTPGQPAFAYRSRCCSWRGCNWRCPHHTPPQAPK